MTQPTAGRHIEALEATLRANLFTRSPRGLIPTPAARELVPHAEAMAAAAAALHRAASGEARGEVGTVRLTASEIVGHEVLPPILADFCSDHPRIVLELVLSNRIAGCHVNVARRDRNLIRVLERAFTFNIDMWLAMHSDARGTRRIRLLFDHLAKGLTAYVKGETLHDARLPMTDAPVSHARNLRTRRSPRP